MGRGHFYSCRQGFLNLSSVWLYAGQHVGMALGVVPVVGGPRDFMLVARGLLGGGFSRKGHGSLVAGSRRRHQQH
jgi:hypothetical protein